MRTMTLYEKVVKYVDNSFGGKKPHFERTVYWYKKLIPEITEAHKIAAYSHDIERAIKGEKEREYLNPSVLKRHQEEGAEIVKNFLQKNGANTEVIEKVKYLLVSMKSGEMKIKTPSWTQILLATSKQMLNIL